MYERDVWVTKSSRETGEEIGKLLNSGKRHTFGELFAKVTREVDEEDIEKQASTQVHKAGADGKS